MSIARFWRETPRRYNLGGARCTNCRTVYFPPRAVCPSCAKHRQSIGRLEPFQLSGEGEVVTFTVVHEPSEGFEMQVPYVLAIVRTTEGPQLTGQIVDIDPASVRIGLKVRATFRKLREEGRAGVIHYGYKFAAAEEAAVRPTAPTRPEAVPAPPASAPARA
ncbi:MAG TPA: Zn-ribbon domain-containing OB-fold protein [Thermoplasmata archaeon]|nr:Zn-ribbon domain-containing OB-fold protein [Thermoplasmata archaeon]HUJ78174.1 Zn-ribbon domain-containing OB-fold protein [Thermoplasmata archaeon]